MDVVRQPLGSLFEPTIQLSAPLFQRPYVWREKSNWEPLWESVTDAADRRREKRPASNHFLGAIVLELVVTNTLGIGNIRTIIDGQQRLTTLQVLMAALRDVAQSKNLAFEAKVVEGLIANESQDPREVQKVVPTTADQDTFVAVMTASSLAGVRKLVKPKADMPRLVEAYLYFAQAITEWIGENDGSASITALTKALQNDLQVVVIGLDGKSDDAQEIFETLNARGEPLLPSDLIKNYLFQRAEADGATADDIRALYDAHWRNFDKDLNYWRKEVGVGRFNNARINNFLQNYLVLKTRTDVLAGNLYRTYKDYARGRPIADELRSVDEYASIFRGFETHPDDSRPGEFFRRLRDLDVTTFHPLLLEVFHRRGELGDVAVAEILRDVESYLVRRTVCRLSARGYNRLVGDLLGKIGDDVTPAAIRAFLLDQTSDNTLWPADQDFKDAWRSEPLYKGRRARVRMIIEALEARARTAKTEDVYFKKKATVEHLMPQNWKKHWGLPAGVPELQADRRRNELLHTIGNLTLLTQELNSDVADSPWNVRLPEILKYSELTLNKELAEIEQWSEDEIDRRADRLFELAKAVWPHPDPERPRAIGVNTVRESVVEETPATSNLDRLLGVFAENLGEALLPQMRSFVVALESIDGIVVRAGKSLRCRLRVEGGGQLRTLFGVEPDGEVWFRSMKTAKAAAMGVDEAVADVFNEQLADTYDLKIKSGKPDGLKFEAILSDPTGLVDALRTFARDVRSK